LESFSRQPPRRPKVSLPRALSKLGHCSRTQAQALIAAGRVRVNGRARTDAAFRVDLERDRIEVDGRRLAPADKIYLMLNKPRGLVTTASDEEGRATVYACLPEDLPYLAPVGRLDKASEGLLLFTNDTRWADRILSPDSHVSKVYHVQVKGPADESLLRRMTEGVTDEGESLSAKRVGVLRRGGRNAWLEVVLDEGKHRHIRRLLAALGVNVLRLVRVAVGPLTLGDLTKGKYRHLTDEERRALEDASSSAKNTR
jgi:23S rRNA pseudouridine2605 synthase